MTTFTITALSPTSMSLLGVIIFTLAIEFLYGVMVYLFATSVANVCSNFGIRKAFVTHPVGSTGYCLSRLIICFASLGGWALASLAFGRVFKLY